VKLGQQITSAFTPATFTTNKYVDVTCGTEIKWRALSFYFLRIIYIFLTGAYIFLSKLFIGTINRYETIVNGDRIPKYLQDSLICSKKDYKKKLKEVSRSYLQIKSSFLFVYILVWVTVTTITFAVPDIRQIVWPTLKTCGGPDEHLVFNDDRLIPYKCHFRHESIIFVLVLSSDLLKVVLFVSFILGTVFLRVYYRRVSALNVDTDKGSQTELGLHKLRQ